MAKWLKPAPRGPRRAPDRVSDGPERSIRMSLVMESVLGTLGMDPQGVCGTVWGRCAPVWAYSAPPQTPEDQSGPRWEQ